VPQNSTNELTQYVLIAGGSRGLGLAMGIELAQKGPFREHSKDRGLLLILQVPILFLLLEEERHWKKPRRWFYHTAKLIPKSILSALTCVTQKLFV